MVTDMTIAVVSIFLNIMVMMAIKADKETSGVMFNMVLASLCSSNMVGAALVKSLSVVHNSYMVAAGRAEYEEGGRWPDC